MRRLQVLITVIALGLVVSVGHVWADGPGAGYGGEKIARINFIDRALRVIQISDGTELRAPDQRMLDNLQVGQWVRVDFVSDGDRFVINYIVPARADEIPGPVPTALGVISNHG